MRALHAAGRPAETLTGYEEVWRVLAAYESRITPFARGCQKIAGTAGPFFAPPTERRIRAGTACTGCSPPGPCRGSSGG
ncbi:hypothetical protein ABZ920_16790 [Streptomyces sp. NPDC046831]|uniref:hypothetical protein n=1 Tax=Streptomyces sp. NPDC046831 TaxID=3154805 RepID=UPI0033F668CC